MELKRNRVTIVTVSVLLIAAAGCDDASSSDGEGTDTGTQTVETGTVETGTEDTGTEDTGIDDGIPRFAVVPGSTQKICQITGEWDYEVAADNGVFPPELYESEDYYAHNRTRSRYQLAGTDLGSSFEHKGNMYLLFGDSFATETIPIDPTDGTSDSGDNPMAADATAVTDDDDPTDCVDLAFLTDPDDETLWLCPSFDGGGEIVQQAGVSDGRNMFVWYSSVQGEGAKSRLGVSENDGADFVELYEVSGNRFINLSVQLVPDLMIPGLEDVGAQDWVFIFGTGPEYRRSDMFLAVVPFVSLNGSQNNMIYFTGLDDNGVPAWSPSEDDARPIIDSVNPFPTTDHFLGVPLEGFDDAEGCIGESDVHYNPVVDAWIAMYNCDFAGIVMHSAALPWGPWSEPEMVFHPVDDGGYCGFLHLTQSFDNVLDLGCEHNVTTPGRENPGSAYGPFVMERYTTGDENTVTLYFTLSMWHPYNVLLFTTQLQRR